MSMAAMRLAFDHASASAVRSSIAAAMVIAEPVLYEFVYNFRLWPTFAGKCQQRVIQSGRGGGSATVCWGNVDFGFRNFAASGDGARLFQRLLQAEAAGDRRCRRDSAVRARASARHPAVSAKLVAGNHAATSRPDDSGAEAMELRTGHHGRSVPARGHAAEGQSICL